MLCHSMEVAQGTHTDKDILLQGVLAVAETSWD